ncbi:GNAT family N-acetyltransferase [Fertoebacter nigrum]|uniref:GNAT family N-acetyltransferase n=1 Tax=Fertoeibacter niger TaxID=2656921 RepID=A0A8X8H2Y6_9RHOB|nr:GNAT family N-acetyltransferase [Fertoeibacter niger]NUB46633.1 GNAT family N-acetyltransferase [Fertoeibacter niger]
MTPFRAVAPFDWAGLLALIQRAFAGMEGRIDPPSSLHALTPADIARSAAEGEVWVIGTPPCACVILTPKPHALYVGKLAVEPAAQRQGHARRLMAVAEDRARAMGLPLLELSARVELVENHATFRALGFEKVAETAHPGFSRTTSLTFAKRL